jgi:hypothetical protein
MIDLSHFFSVCVCMYLYNIYIHRHELKILVILRFLLVVKENESKYTDRYDLKSLLIKRKIN